MDIKFDVKSDPPRSLVASEATKELEKDHLETCALGRTCGKATQVNARSSKGPLPSGWPTVFIWPNSAISEENLVQ